MKKIAYSKASIKTLRRLSATDAKRIVAKIEQYADDPTSLTNNVKALVGSPYIRLRVGNWRVIMDDDGHILEIIQIGPRGSVYQWELRMQTIKTPNGETLVILPLAEYESLIDQADIAAANRIKADISAGRDELVPAEIVTRLLSGESAVKVWRSHRGLSAKDLAAEAGISAPYLSEIESGKKEGSLSVMKKIAEVLKVDLDDLT